MRAYTARLSDEAIVHLIEDSLPREPEPGDCTLFIEGPTEAGFFAGNAPVDVERIGRLWSLRLFSEGGEVAARRRDFSSEDGRPWLARVVSRKEPDGDGWREHELSAPTPHYIALLGEANNEGRFLDGRLRDALHYPSASGWRGGERAQIKIIEYAVSSGPPIMVWESIERSDSRDGSADGKGANRG